MPSNPLSNNLCININDKQINNPGKNYPINIFVSSNKNIPKTVQNIITIKELMSNKPTIYLFGVLNYIIGPLNKVIKKMKTYYLLNKITIYSFGIFNYTMSSLNGVLKKMGTCYLSDRTINNICNLSTYIKTIKCRKDVRCRMIYEINYIIESFIKNPTLQLILDLISIESYFKYILRIMPNNLRYLTEHKANVDGYENINNIFLYSTIEECINKHGKIYFAFKNNSHTIYNKSSTSINNFMSYDNYVAIFNKFKYKFISSCQNTDITIHVNRQNSISVLNERFIDSKKIKKLEFTEAKDFTAFSRLMTSYLNKYIDFIENYKNKEIVSFLSSDCDVAPKSPPKHASIYDSDLSAYVSFSIFEIVENNFQQANIVIDTTVDDSLRTTNNIFMIMNILIILNIIQTVNILTKN
jgi:hypothetical protein